MLRVTPGLVAAIVIAVLVATFPFYAEALTPLLWSIPPTGSEEHGYGGGETSEAMVSGIVEKVDASEGLIILKSGEEVRLRGDWIVEMNGVEKEMYYDELASLIKPGEELRVYCRLSQRWGCLAEELWFNGVHAVKTSGE